MSSSLHIPVLADEVLHALAPQPGQIYADGTLGGGGHTRLLAERVGPAGRIVAVDRDPQVIARAERNLAGLPVQIAQADYTDLPEVLDAVGVTAVQGILLDLGLSSDQLADVSRGFSFAADGPLDLRFDPEEGEPAWRLLARLRADELAQILHDYGEERFSRRIARAIVEQRQHEPIRTARELAHLVHRCVPPPKHHRIDTATRTFQALRIAVNHELASLDRALQRLPDRLSRGGRLVVISFHSLEDRRVKTALRSDARLQVVTRKPIRPTAAEVEQNPRAGSARMRVAERV
ncbi:MAG: 16S rRNA (cytosine(1402)-N(4))-methyltransferase RsmH [Pirellulaceae bacterium]|nr:16S rRNA (cytosine(1402)-N(4))-methyltransferase RsmH [Pirellulaceae bacterium]